MLLCVAIVTCPGYCTGRRQSTLGSVWSLAAVARRPPGTTGTEGYHWQPEVRGQGVRGQRSGDRRDEERMTVSGEVKGEAFQEVDWLSEHRKLIS